MIQPCVGLLLLAGFAACMGPVVRRDKAHHRLARRGPRSPHRTHINGGDPPSSTGSDVNQTVSGDESAPASHDGELPMERIRRAFGRNDYLLPENFKTLRRSDIPVTYRLHDDLLRYYRKGTRPVTHPSKIVSVSMSVFLYQIVKLDAVKNTISLSGSFELVGGRLLSRHFPSFALSPSSLCPCLRARTPPSN